MKTYSVDTQKRAQNWLGAAVVAAIIGFCGVGVRQAQVAAEKAEAALATSVAAQSAAEDRYSASEQRDWLTQYMDVSEIRDRELQETQEAVCERLPDDAFCNSAWRDEIEASRDAFCSEREEHPFCDDVLDARSRR